MSYVYRYAGMLEQSTIECDKALALDPGSYTFRSCAWSFMELGNTKRAADLIRLDAGSEWATYVKPSLLLREGDIAKAREAVRQWRFKPYLQSGQPVDSEARITVNFTISTY